MDLSKSYDFFKPEKCKNRRIHIIGCGSVGSTVAELLVRFGLSKITLYDFDTVSSHNIANQMFFNHDIGRLKTEALMDHLIMINPDIEPDLKLESKGYNGNNLSGYVFLCADSVELCRKIAEDNKGNMHIDAMFDFRIGLTDAQHYAADWKDRDMVDNLIKSMNFSSEEAKKETPVSACNLPLSVAPAIRSICSFGVMNMINFVNGAGIKKMIVNDVGTCYLESF